LAGLQPAAIRSCAALLKPGAPLLLYLYYATDNRPRWFRWLWQFSHTARLAALAAAAVLVCGGVQAAIALQTSRQHSDSDHQALELCRMTRRRPAQVG